MTTVATMPGLATPSTTGGIKRKRVIDADSAYGSSQLQTPSSPMKKLKVEFDMTKNTTHFMEDWNEKGVQLVREEVRVALQQHHSGDSAGYDAIKHLFVVRPSTAGAPGTSLLRKYLLALSANAGQLDKSCNGLVKAVLESPWYGRDDGFVKAYLYFLSAILNAYNGYTRHMFDSLVTRFADMPPSVRRVCLSEPITRKQIFDRLHQAISQVLSDFPSSSTVLADSLAANFPHPTDSRLAHNDFATNIIRITRYAPSLRNASLSLLTERLVKLDSRIAMGLDKLSTEDNELRSLIVADHEEELAKADAQHGEDNSFSDAESDLSDSDSDSDSDLDEDLDDVGRAQKEFREGAARLDDLLNILFAYYEPIITSKGGRFAQEVFDHMIEQFVTNMLPDRSRSVQFLLFRYAQSTPEMATQFIETCQRIFEEQTYPQRVRGNAGTFLASFVARGKNITEDQVRTVVYRLGKIMDHRRIQHELTARGPDLNRYFTYYLATQAILYIVCFRWRELLVFDEDVEETVDEQIEQIALRERDAVWPHELKQQLFSSIHSVLNPLRVCAEDVVDVFDEVSNYLGLMYCHTIIERNRRNPITRALTSISEYSARETALSAHSTVKLRLPSEYPFDPYELPRSKHWVEGVYKGWQEPPGMSKPEEPEDSSDAEDDEDDDVDEYDDDTESES